MRGFHPERSPEVNVFTCIALVAEIDLIRRIGRCETDVSGSLISTGVHVPLGMAPFLVIATATTAML